MQKKRSFQVAIGGVFSALAVGCMMLTLFPYATYALPAVAGLCLLPVARECGRRWGFAAFAAVAMLTALIAPDPEAKWLFVFFFGYYPILKGLLDRLTAPLRWTLKLALFNGAVVSSYLLLLFVFQLDAGVFELFGVNMPLVFLIAGNVIFLLYDRAIGDIARQYEFRWRDRLRRIWKL